MVTGVSGQRFVAGEECGAGYFLLDKLKDSGRFPSSITIELEAGCVQARAPVPIRMVGHLSIHGHKVCVEILIYCRGCLLAGSRRYQEISRMKILWKRDRNGLTVGA